MYDDDIPPNVRLNFTPGNSVTECALYDVWERRRGDQREATWKQSRRSQAKAIHSRETVRQSFWADGTWDNPNDEEEQASLEDVCEFGRFAVGFDTDLLCRVSRVADDSDGVTVTVYDDDGGIVLEGGVIYSNDSVNFFL